MADNNIVGAELTMSLDEAKILVMQGMKGDPGESPRINPENNHWEVYDNDTEQWVDTGVNARGPKGDPGSGEGGGSSLPEVDSSDVGKVLRVNSDVEWDVLDPPTGVPNYSGARLGSVLKLYRPSPNSANGMTWGPPGYQIPVTSSGGVYTVDSAVTAEDIVANKGNLVIIVNGSLEYNCVGALTSDFLYGHFYFVAAKPTASAIETEWLDLQFFTGENGSVSVTPVSFDIKGTKWIFVQPNPGTGGYTPNFTAADVANGLPNVVLTLGESRYIPVGWETDEGYLVNATFARATYDSNGYAGLDCFKVNNTGGSFTVRRYTVPVNGAFVIPVTSTTSGGVTTYSTTATFAEIMAHYPNLVVRYGNLYYTLSYSGTSDPNSWYQFVFSAQEPNNGDLDTEWLFVLCENNSVTITAASLDIKGLPAVTTADNGKVLKVVNGVWTAVSE